MKICSCIPPIRLQHVSIAIQCRPNDHLRSSEQELTENDPGRSQYAIIDWTWSCLIFIAWGLKASTPTGHHFILMIQTVRTLILSKARDNRMIMQHNAANAKMQKRKEWKDMKRPASGQMANIGRMAWPMEINEVDVSLFVTAEPWPRLRLHSWNGSVSTCTNSPWRPTSGFFVGSLGPSWSMDLSGWSTVDRWGMKQCGFQHPDISRYIQIQHQDHQAWPTATRQLFWAPAMMSENLNFTIHHPSFEKIWYDGVVMPQICSNANSSYRTESWVPSFDQYFTMHHNS